MSLGSIQHDLVNAHTHLAEAQEKLQALMDGVPYKPDKPEPVDHFKVDLDFSPTAGNTYTALALPDMVGDYYKIRLEIDTSAGLEGVDEDDFLNLMWMGPPKPGKPTVIDWKKTYGYWLLRYGGGDSYHTFISNVVREEDREVDEDRLTSDSYLILEIEYTRGILDSRVRTGAGEVWWVEQILDWPPGPLLAWFSMPENHREEPSIGWTYKTLEVWNGEA